MSETKQEDYDLLFTIDVQYMIYFIYNISLELYF